MSRTADNLRARLQSALGEIGIGCYSFLGCAMVIGVAGLAAMLSAQPWLFPSLGPTLLMFFERDRQPSACPRNTLYGHALAIAAGWLGLALFGLIGAPSILSAGMTSARIGAAALSLGLTAFAKHILRAPHPPAGASTLIVSLGFLTTPAELAAMFGSIILVTVVGWIFNRLMGVPMPIWFPRADDVRTRPPSTSCRHH